MKHMDHISQLLPKALRKHGLKDEVDASMIAHSAQSWITEQKLNGVTVTKFQDHTIVIEVTSSVIAEECHALTEALLEHLRNEFPLQRIDGVRILRETTKPVR